MNRLGSNARVLSLIGLLLVFGGKVYAQAAGTIDHSLDQTETKGGQEHDAQDRKFLKTAMEGEMAQLQLGQLALQRCSDSNIKEFAQRIVDDQDPINAQIKQMASRLGVPVPARPAGEDRSAISKLSKLSGGEFDLAFMNVVMKNEKQIQSAFRHEVSSGQDPALRDEATHDADIVTKDLEVARQIAKEANLN